MIMRTVFDTVNEYDYGFGPKSKKAFKKKAVLGSEAFNCFSFPSECQSFLSFAFLEMIDFLLSIFLSMTNDYHFNGFIV